MDGRNGHKAMKESYMTEAKLRKKRDTESFRDFGQGIHDLYRQAYPDNRDYVKEASRHFWTTAVKTKISV